MAGPSARRAIEAAVGAYSFERGRKHGVRCGEPVDLKMLEEEHARRAEKVLDQGNVDDDGQPEAGYN